MYYLLLQADHEENTLQDYHHSLQNVSLLFIYIIKKIFLLKKLLLMEIWVLVIVEDFLCKFFKQHRTNI